MSYDDDAAYDEARDWQVMTEYRRRELTDKDYPKLVEAARQHRWSDDPLTLFLMAVKDLVSGFKIAVKIKDAELHKRFWLSEALDTIVNYVKFPQVGPMCAISLADSYKMAKAVEPLVRLMREWAEGLEKYEEKVNFETGQREMTLAGEIDHRFLWIYTSLVAQKHSPVDAAHALLFLYAMQGDPSRGYVFRVNRFQALLRKCAVYAEKHRVPSETETLFWEEMKKPYEERFFNVDDDEDEELYSSGDVHDATSRSRLKAYLFYRQQAVELHKPLVSSSKDAITCVRDEMSALLEDAKKAELKGFDNRTIRQCNGRGWHKLLLDALMLHRSITYRDFDVDRYDPEDLVDDPDYHKDEGWPYLDVSETIPESDACAEITRDFLEYFYTLTSLSVAIHSATSSDFLKAFSKTWYRSGFLCYTSEEKDVKATIDTISRNIKQLRLELELYKNGQTLLFNVGQVLKTVSEHSGALGAKLDDVHKAADAIIATQNEEMGLSRATNERVLTSNKMLRSLKKYNTVGKTFGFGDQELCFNFWVHDRVSPTLVHGRKVFYVDSFNAHKERLAKNGVTDIGTYRKLIEDYRKRTGSKIPNTKRKVEAAKSEIGNGKRKPQAGKRKTARGKRKSTPGKRKPK